MACVIAAPASGSGKTLLTLCLIAWARHQGKSIQPFKVGPDYLDPQLLSLSAGNVCRNLDLSLCGHRPRTARRRKAGCPQTSRKQARAPLELGLSGSLDIVSPWRGGLAPSGASASV